MKISLAITLLAIGTLAVGAWIESQDHDVSDARMPRAASGAAMTIDAGVVESCRACHKEGLSLAGRNPDELAQQISSIVAGRAEHLVPIPSLPQTEIDELAQALATE